MAGITLAQLETRLQLYLDAEVKVLSGQAYTLGGVSMTRADLDTIRDEIKNLDVQIQRKSRGGARIRQIVPVSN